MSSFFPQTWMNTSMTWVRFYANFLEPGGTLNLDKGTWSSDEVENLGNSIRPVQPHMHKENASALKHAKVPSTTRQLKILLGRCNVNRRFPKDFARRVHRTTCLTSCRARPPWLRRMISTTISHRVHSPRRPTAFLQGVT